MKFHSIIFAAASFLALGQIAQAAPLDVHIVSGANWRSTDVAPSSGWNDSGFNDSTWRFARAPYPNPSTPATILGGPTSAQFIWDDAPPLSADGGGGPDEVWLRYTFTLAFAPDSLPYLGQGLIAVDDDFELFVNGTSVLLNADGGFATNVYAVDFTSRLRAGENVIAIHGRDGSWFNPSDRSYQWALFDGVIRTVPEPASLVLFGAGLLGLVAARRARRGAATVS